MRSELKVFVFVCDYCKVQESNTVVFEDGAALNHNAEDTLPKGWIRKSVGNFSKDRCPKCANKFQVMIGEKNG